MNTQDLPALIGRVMLAVLFLMAGLSKFGGLEGTAGYIASKGLPMPQVLAIGTAVVETVAGAMLIVGWQARWAALALAAFTVLASLLFHNFWAMPAEQQMMQQQAFMKNFAIVGGLLLVFAFGPGSISFDEQRTRT